MEIEITKLIAVAVVLSVGFIVNYFISRHEFKKEMKGKKTETLITNMMHNRKTKGWRKRRLFAYITKVRGSQILKPKPLTSEQIKELPKGKHFVLRKNQIKK